MSKNNHDKKLKESVANLQPEPDPRDLTDITVVPIDCTAFSMQCFDNNRYNNFRILTLKIVAGIVVDIKYSDPYASFEFIDKFESETRPHLYKLNHEWKDGKCLG